MKLKFLFPALAIAASLTFAGCKGEHDHDHDHDHEHGEHGEHADHKEGDTDKGAEHKDGDGDKAAAEPKDAEAGLKAAATDVKDAAVAGVKAAAGDAQMKAYTLETCIVAGSKLGSMGEPAVLVHEGQQVKFCCESCIPKFKADPAKYLAKLTVDKK